MGQVCGSRSSDACVTPRIPKTIHESSDSSGTTFEGLADLAPPDAIRTEPADAWAWLMAGNRAFAEGKCSRGPMRSLPSARHRDLHSQTPIATVLACSDSRVSPSLMFGCGPGDLFVVRNAGALLTDAALASIEYGTAVTGTPLLVVVGHESCGAITASLDAAAGSGGCHACSACLGSVLKQLGASIDATGLADDRRAVVDRAVRAHARATAKDVLRRCPAAAAMVAAGRLRVVCCHYGLATGRVSGIS